MTTAKKARRRSPGEGSVWPYKLENGETRWAISYPGAGCRRDAAGWGKNATEARKELRKRIEDLERGELVEPSKQPLGAYLATWLDGLRLEDSTVASYRKNVRLHVVPYIGDVPLSALTPARLASLYRTLETSGRKDYREGEGLSPRTVKYIHTIVGAALSAAVSAGLIARNPAADPKQCKPPSAKAAKAPEMHPWSAGQLSAFLAWSAANSTLHAAWWTLAMTGMRRGELLALRWHDVDLDEGTIAIRRSAGIVRTKGKGAVLAEGPTKTCRPRGIDIDAGTMTVLRAWKRDRGSLALALARDDALVFGDLEGRHLHPERFSRTFKTTLGRCARALGDEAPPAIRLHDLRHTHATILLADREPLKTVSERLGHASAVVTMSVYAHVLPGDQKRAADRFATLIREA